MGPKMDHVVAQGSYNYHRHYRYQGFLFDRVIAEFVFIVIGVDLIR